MLLKTPWTSAKSVSFEKHCFFCQLNSEILVVHPPRWLKGEGNPMTSKAFAAATLAIGHPRSHKLKTSSQRILPWKGVPGCHGFSKKTFLMNFQTCLVSRPFYGQLLGPPLEIRPGNGTAKVKKCRSTNLAILLCQAGNW